MLANHILKTEGFQMRANDNDKKLLGTYCDAMMAKTKSGRSDQPSSPLWEGVAEELPWGDWVHYLRDPTG